MATRFRALAAPIDVSTGDRGRLGDALTVADTPLPLRWPREDIGGHDGAVTIGKIDKVEMGDNEVWVEGVIFDDIDRERMPRLAEDVATAMTLIREGVLGLSVDLDDFDAVPVRVGSNEPVDIDALEDPEVELELLVTKGRIRAATLVDIPAYVETNHTFELYEDDECDVTSEDEDEISIVASVSGDSKLPVVDDREHEWDGGAAAGRVFDAYSDEDGNVDKQRAGKAFLWVDGDGTKRGDYRLGFADIVDGELRIVPRGVAALAGGRGIGATKGISSSDQKALEGRTCTLYARVREQYEDWPECPFDSDEAAHAALVATMATADIDYPARAFVSPVEIKGPTPITYDFEADPPRAYGHIALRHTCHVGFKDTCVLPPIDESGDYPEFNRIPIETEDGPVFAGRITVGGRHAGLELSADATRRAYDDKTEAAYVQATTDKWGIFVCGPIAADIDDRTMRVLTRRKVSGDWREVAEGLALVEVLALSPGPRLYSEPGFPVATHSYRGRQTALVASFGPEPEGAPQRVDVGEIAREAFAAFLEIQAEEGEKSKLREELASLMGMDAEKMRAELALAVGDA